MTYKYHDWGLKATSDDGSKTNQISHKSVLLLIKSKMPLSHTLQISIIYLVKES